MTPKQLRVSDDEIDDRESNVSETYTVYDKVFLGTPSQIIILLLP